LDPGGRKLAGVFWLALWKVRIGMTGRFRAFGGSMEPVLPSGSLVTIEPVEVERIELGDIVAVKVGDDTMLHLVKAIDPHERRVEIAGTRGPPSGWTSFEYVYAICTRIDGKVVPGVEGKTRTRFLGIARPIIRRGRR
jgi:hypothetical protein